MHEWEKQMEKLLCAGASGALVLIAACSPSTSTDRQPAPYNASTLSPGFSLRGFTGKPSGHMIIYEGNEATRLASAILPDSAEQVRRVVVYKLMMVPGLADIGLNFYFTLQMQGHDSSLCEEAHVLVTLRRDRAEPFPSGTQFTISNGTVQEHQREGIGYERRFHRLAKAPGSQGSLVEACQEFADATRYWKLAESWTDIVEQEQALDWLIRILDSPDRATITCTGTDGKPCTRRRSEFIAMLRAVPPDSSQRTSSSGPIHNRIFEYHEAYESGKASVDYTVMTLERAGRKPEVDFRFRPTMPQLMP